MDHTWHFHTYVPVQFDDKQGQISHGKLHTWNFIKKMISHYSVVFCEWIYVWKCHVWSIAILSRGVRREQGATHMGHHIILLPEGPNKWWLQQFPKSYCWTHRHTDRTDCSSLPLTLYSGQKYMHPTTCVFVGFFLFVFRRVYCTLIE